MSRSARRSASRPQSVGSCFSSCSRRAASGARPLRLWPGAKAFNGMCWTKASCGDGLQNGDETAIDCGGSCAPCGPAACVDEIEVHFYTTNTATSSSGGRPAMLPGAPDRWVLSNAPVVDATAVDTPVVASSIGSVYKVWPEDKGALMWHRAWVRCLCLAPANYTLAFWQGELRAGSKRLELRVFRNGDHIIHLVGDTFPVVNRVDLNVSKPTPAPPPPTRILTCIDSLVEVHTESNLAIASVIQYAWEISGDGVPTVESDAFAGDDASPSRKGWTDLACLIPGMYQFCGRHTYKIAFNASFDVGGFVELRREGRVIAGPFAMPPRFTDELAFTFAVLPDPRASEFQPGPVACATPVEVQIVPRAGASEIGWAILGHVSVPYATYLDFEPSTTSVCLPPGRYTLEARDLFGDGWGAGATYAVRLQGVPVPLVPPSPVHGFRSTATFEVPDEASRTTTSTPAGPGPVPADCPPGLWGADCQTPWPCSGHGTCNRQTGACVCFLAHANCTPLLEEKDPKNDRLKNYFFWTFATHMTQIPPKKNNFTQFAAFFHFLFFKINYYFV